MSNALRATRVWNSGAALALASALFAAACSKPEAAPAPSATSAPAAVSAAAPAPPPAPREYKAADADDMQLQWELGKMVDKKLSDDEVHSVVTFLGALACEKLVEPKKLP